MLSYTQKLNTKEPTGRKVKMANFDLYCDLPPISAAEDDRNPYPMTSADIATLTSKPYLRPRSSSAFASDEKSTDSMSAIDGILPSRNEGDSYPKNMLEIETSSSKANFLDHSIVSTDCITVIPQNTKPMAKYRKNYVKKKRMAESAEEEGYLTDEQLWKKRKAEEEMERREYYRRLYRRTESDLEPMDWDLQGEDFTKKKNLDEEIYKPTYVTGADLDGENFLSAIGKTIPKKRIAIVTSLMQKIEKRKQEKQERDLNEKILKALRSTDEEQRRKSMMLVNEPIKEEEEEDREQGEENAEVILPEKKSMEEKVDTDPLLDKLTVSLTTESGTYESSIVREDASENKDSLAPSPEPSLITTYSTSRRHSLADTASTKDDPSNSGKTAHSQPISSYKTRDLISYSELLMASARDKSRVTPTTGISKSVADFRHMFNLDPANDGNAESFILPPEIDEVKAKKSSKLSQSMKEINRRDGSASRQGRSTSKKQAAPVANQVEPQIQRSTKRRSTSQPRRQSYRNAGVNLNTTSKRRRRQSFQESPLVTQLTQIVKNQNHLIERMQKMQEIQQRNPRRHRSMHDLGRRDEDTSDGSTVYKRSDSSLQMRAQPKIYTPRRKSMHDLTSSYNNEVYELPVMKTEPVRKASIKSNSSFTSLSSYDSPEEEDDLSFPRTFTTQFDDLTNQCPVENSLGQQADAELFGNQENDESCSESDDQVQQLEIPKLVLPSSHWEDESGDDITQSSSDDDDDSLSTEESMGSPDEIKLDSPPATREEMLASQSKPIVAPRNKTPIISPSIIVNGRPTSSSAPHKESTVASVITKPKSKPVVEEQVRPSSKVQGKVNDKFSDDEIRIAPLGSRRRRSTIRVKGIRRTPGETAENLNNKVQAVLDPTNASAYEITWSKRENQPNNKEKSGLLHFIKSFFGFKSKPEPITDDDTVIAEVVQNVTTAEVDEVTTSSSVPQAVAISAEVNQTEPATVSKPKLHPRTSKADAPSSWVSELPPKVQFVSLPEREKSFTKKSKSIKKRRTSKDGLVVDLEKPAQKNLLSLPDEEVSDVGPLPSPIISPTSRRLKSRPNKQCSIDSGFSTNPPEDEADLSPKLKSAFYR